MVGQGRPITQRNPEQPFTAAQIARSVRLFLSCAFVFLLLGMATHCWAESFDVRLRFAWGSSKQTRQQWTGRIGIEGGTFGDLQPLGIEPDESAALLLEENQIIVAPLNQRGFDGCDVSVRADGQATLRFELAGDPTLQPTLLEVPLEQVTREHWQAPLDEHGSFLLVHRSPGDRLRIKLSQKSLIFQPGERWQFQLQPDLQAELVQGPVQLDLKLSAVGEKTVLWQDSRQLSSETPTAESLEFEVDCPEREGAYRLTIQAHSREGFAGRLVPGQQAKLLATREVELVVLDPDAKQPPLSERWEPVLSFNPASPKWWQRLPAWARVPQLPGVSQGALGNVRPLVRPLPTGNVIELPPADQQDDPAWQAYTLAVKESGIPHLLEIEIPRQQAQHLAISIVEPDAAGRMVSFGRDTGVFTEGSKATDNQETALFRLVFWPRTRSPQVVLVNRHPTAVAQFGRIKLSSQHPTVDDTATAIPMVSTGRLAAGYIASPRFVDNMGAAEVLDPQSGLSVDGWSTFLEASRRLAQYVRYRGYNGVLFSVAADSSSLYPNKLLGQSPRYDTGVLAASGQDPVRKDVLELLLRVFDREGLRVVPTLQLATPLPQLESLRRRGDPAQLGIEWLNPQGRTWLQQNVPLSGRAPYYNALNNQVQTALVEIVSELTQRYASHKSFAGVALQLSGDGYAVLPSAEWGMDDQTVADFSQATSVPIAGDGPNRFQQRAEQLLGTHAQQWQAWRLQRLTQLYKRLARTLQSERSDLQLVLATEKLFAGEDLERSLRLALTGRTQLNRVLRDHGIDLTLLGQVSGIVPLSPHRLAANDDLQRRALDLRINAAAERAELMTPPQRPAPLLYHVEAPLRLPSFDRVSSSGPANTYFSTASQSLSLGADARRHLIHALARNDTSLLVEGSELLSLGQSHLTRQLLQAWQQLPSPATEVRTEIRQPLVARVYREADTTTVCLINEAPWPLQVELPLDSVGECSWLRVGRESVADQEPLEDELQQGTLPEGTLAEGSQSWQIVLQPYDLQAWSFRSSQLRVGEPTITLGREVQTALQQRIGDIESRTSNLNIRRPYRQIVNPDFEQPGSAGWQPLLGPTGLVEADDKQAHSGAVSMHLQSRDQFGVALQSQLFPLPETGQLVVSVHLRAEGLSPSARVSIVLQDSTDGRTYRQSTIVGKENPLSNEWSRYEFSVDDLPLKSSEPLQLRFHLAGRGDVWIDDVQLFDLQFDDRRRVEMVKKVYAARTTLDQGQVVDCLRLVDDYWSRYLVEYVPPLSTNPAHTAQVPAVTSEPQTQEESPTDEEDRGFGERLRSFVPRLWR